MNITPPFDNAGSAYQNSRISHWDSIALKSDSQRGLGRWYHRRLAEIYRFHITPNLSVLELGCGNGKLLGVLNPARAVGLDFSQEMIRRAQQKYPSFEFIHADAHDLSGISETFDVIILSDLVNDLWDVQRVFEQIKAVSTPRTRIIINFYSRLWQLPLSLGQTPRAAQPN